MTEVTITRHICVSIKGLEKHLLAQDEMWQIFEHNDGTFLSYGEVWAELERCRALGYDAISGCDFVDERGYCKGHPHES